MRETIAVIGSNSFTGAHFARYALEQGADVLALSRSEEPAECFLPYRWKTANPIKGEYQFFAYDLNRHLDQMTKLFNDRKPAYIVNFASQSMVAESWLNPMDWFQTNVMGHIRLHETLRQLPYLKRYVHISTPEVYGSCQGPVKETAPYNPSTPYAVSRAAADMSLMTFFRNYKFPVVFTRAANVYGPGQQLYRIIPRAILAAKKKEKFPLHGGGASVRSFIHVQDVVRGTWLAMDTNVLAQNGEIFHFSTPRMMSIRELVEMIAQRMGVRFDEIVENAHERPGKDASYWLDSSKAKELLNWEPEISIEAGLDETIAWAGQYFDQLLQQSLRYQHKP